ncbi:nodulin MtN21/EamA-like transporter family protein, partial [Trifolium medium]|nr:nodulin MtN21/EamA-like transporter family protein [Trifolium medium]
VISEPNASAWKIGLDTSLASILCSGAVYVAMFKPLSIVIAVAMGVVFLGDTLHLGSLIGATIISIGFYTVMWGKATEEVVEDVPIHETTTTQNAPLLQSYKTEVENKMHTSV